MSVVTRLRAPCALLLASAACASIDPAKGHDEVSQLVQARTGAATSFAQGRPEDAQVQAQLDRLLAHGLTPQTAVQIALLSNPQLLATYEDLGVSQAELVQAGLLSNPKLAFGLGFPLGQSGGGVAFDLSLAQNFLDLFLMPLKKRAARTQFDADVLHVAQETLAVAAATQQACAELQAQERVVELEREALETHRLTRDFAARLHEAGNTTELAFATEQAAFEDTSLELGKEELTRVELREKLNLLLGLAGPRAEWTLADALPELPSQDPTLDELERTALAQRLDLASLQKRIELQQQALSLAQDSRAFGLIELGLDFRQDTEGPRLLGPSLTLELPLFDQRGALIAKLDAELHRAQRLHDAQALKARVEARLARARLLEARERATHLRTVLVPLRERVLRETQLSANAMQVGLRDLLLARHGVLEAQTQELRARRDYWLAHTALALATGGSLSIEEHHHE